MRSGFIFLFLAIAFALFLALAPRKPLFTNDLQGVASFVSAYTTQRPNQWPKTIIECGDAMIVGGDHAGMAYVRQRVIRPCVLTFGTNYPTPPACLLHDATRTWDPRPTTSAIVVYPTGQPDPYAIVAWECVQL